MKKQLFFQSQLFKFIKTKIGQIKKFFWPDKTNNFQPYILTDKIILFFILLLFLTKVVFSLQLVWIQRSALFADLSAQKIIALTNDLRQKYGLPPLKENPLLNKAAQQKAEDMIKNNYFSHYSPNGISPWYWIKQSGYKYHYAGENLAMNFIESEEVVKAWFNSPTHRANLLNKNYNDIGLAIVLADFSQSGIKQPIVVQLFASPQANKTQTTTEANIPVKENLKETRISPTVTTILSFNKKAEVLGEEKKETVTITTTTISTSTTTTLKEPLSNVSIAVVSTSPLIGNLQAVNDLPLDIRTQINIFNKIIALILIILGSLIIVGIILNQRSIPFDFSEIVLRSSILIIIGATFLAFNLERFIGQLIIL